MALESLRCGMPESFSLESMRIGSGCVATCPFRIQCAALPAGRYLFSGGMCLQASQIRTGCAPETYGMRTGCDPDPHPLRPGFEPDANAMRTGDVLDTIRIDTFFALVPSRMRAGCERVLSWLRAQSAPETRWARTSCHLHLPPCALASSPTRRTPCPFFNTPDEGRGSAAVRRSAAATAGTACPAAATSRKATHPADDCRHPARAAATWLTKSGWSRSARC